MYIENIMRFHLFDYCSNSATIASKRDIQTMQPSLLNSHGIVRVTTQSSNSEIVATLVGNYAQEGKNHGRKFYQKIWNHQSDDIRRVFLYYWDQRDGAEWSGWWFGETLGGSDCWARCSTCETFELHRAGRAGLVALTTLVGIWTPPRIGWKIPWDAEGFEPGQLIVDVNDDHLDLFIAEFGHLF